MEGADAHDLSLDERFLVAVALKNRLLTRDAVKEAIRRRAQLAREGLAYSLEAVLVRDELLSPEAIDRIRRAQAATHAMRLDELYAQTARRLGVVDAPDIERVLAKRRRAPQLDRIGDALMDRGMIAPEAHARVLREMRRGIAAGEQAYVTELRERVGTEPLPAAPRSSGRLPAPAPAPPPQDPPVGPSRDEAAPRDAPRPSDDDLYESAVRALPAVVGRKRPKELRDRDLKALDDSISEAELPAARAPAAARPSPATRKSGRSVAVPRTVGGPRAAPRRPQGPIAAIVIAVLLGAGAIVAGLTSGEDGEAGSAEAGAARQRTDGTGRAQVASPARSGAPGRAAAGPSSLGTLPEVSRPAEGAHAPGESAGRAASRPLEGGERTPASSPSSAEGATASSGASGTATASIETPTGPDAAAFQRLFNRGQLAEKAGRLEEALALYRAARIAAEPESARAVLVNLRIEAVERALAASKADASRAEELWKRAIEALREGRAIDALSPLDTLAGSFRDDRAARAAAFARDLGDMAFVPAGSFVMGTDESDIPHARPPHEVETPAFFIDRHETTNALYRAYAEQTGAERPATWIAPGRNPLPGDEEHPVAGVSAEEAARFGEWRGKRLPREEEWERAARGGDRRRFPWGGLGGAGANVGASAETGGTRPVGSSPGDVSALGCLDMGGNVAEWTASPFLPYPGGDARAADFSAELRVVRGGSWRYEPSYARCAWRDRARPGERFPEVGFRCVKDVPAWLPELR